MYKDDLRLYVRLLAYLKPHKFRMIAAILAMLGVSALTAALAYLVNRSWTTSSSGTKNACSSCCRP